MSSIAFEILIILLLVTANGLFAMSEIATVSARKARLQQMANKGDKRAQVALELANSPNRFLSTVQIGITLIGILAGAFGGATLAAKLVVVLREIPVVAPYSQALSLGIVVLIITYLSLVIGELVPKRIGLHSPERIATAVSQPLSLLSVITAPIVHLLSASTELILKLLNVQPSEEEPEATEEEIKILLQQGTEAGAFEEVEQDIVERVFRLGDRRVSTLMTPRPDVVWLDLEDSMEVNRQTLTTATYSRFPVCRDGLDNMLGIVHVNDLLNQSLAGQPIDLTRELRQALYIPESTHALKVLELFKQSSTHIALVVDEYGVIQGLVTLTDILEAIVGDLPVDETEEPQIIQREDGSWLLDGMLSIDGFKELLDIEDEELPGEDRGNFHTLGGFVVMHLGHIPVSADHFEWKNFRFEVMDMDGNRVDKVLVMPVKRAIEPEVES